MEILFLGLLGLLYTIAGAVAFHESQTTGEGRATRRERDLV